MVRSSSEEVWRFIRVQVPDPWGSTGHSGRAEDSGTGCLWANPQTHTHSSMYVYIYISIDVWALNSHTVGVSSSVQYLWLLLLPSEHSLNFYRQGGGARVKGQRETEASGHIYLSSLRQPTASFSEQCRAMVSKVLTAASAREIWRNTFTLWHMLTMRKTEKLI